MKNNLLALVAVVMLRNQLHSFSELSILIRRESHDQIELRAISDSISGHDTTFETLVHATLHPGIMRNVGYVGRCSR